MQKCIDKYGLGWYYNDIKRKQKQNTKETHSIHSIENMKGMKIKRKARVIPLGQ